jgi:DNA primase
VTLPEGEDPDSFVLRHGRDGLEAQLTHAIDVFERKLQILQRGGWFGDLRRKRVALDRLLPTIRAAADPITRGLYLDRAAEVSGVTTDVLERELRQAKPPKGRPKAASPSQEVPERRKRQVDRRRPQSLDPAERELVRVMLHRRQDVEGVAEQVGAENFREPGLASIFKRLVASPDEALDSLASALDEESVGVLDDLASDRGGLDDPQKIIRDCVSVMRKHGLSAKLDSLNRQLPLAQGTEKDELMREMGRLQAEMQTLGGPSRWKSFGRTRQ